MSNTAESDTDRAETGDGAGSDTDGVGTEEWAETEGPFGLAGNIAAAVGYIVPVLALVFLFVEEDNEFVRFAAAQSVVFAFGLLVFRYAVTLSILLFPTLFAVLLGPVRSLVNLAIFVGLVILAYKAYSGETVELPVFADPARTLEQSV